MSEYRKFERCIVCRTLYNLEKYSGEFEETMLINSLYMTVMFPIEHRNKIHLKSSVIARYLEERHIVTKHENSFNSDDIVRYLRNSLAHYNIKVNKGSENISHIKLWGINPPDKTICKHPCESPKCVQFQYNSNENNEIITFDFDINQLRDFTKFIINSVLEILDSNICIGCKYANYI